MSNEGIPPSQQAIFDVFVHDVFSSFKTGELSGKAYQERDEKYFRDLRDLILRKLHEHPQSSTMTVGDLWTILGIASQRHAWSAREHSVDKTDREYRLRRMQGSLNLLIDAFEELFPGGNPRDQRLLFAE